MRKQILGAVCALAGALVPQEALAVVAPGDLVIREFRLRGPSSATDEYVVIHNRTASDITIAAPDASGGFGVASSNGTLAFTIPNGTVIKARGHFLAVNTSGFSLGVPYNASWTADITDGLGLALFDSANASAFGSTATTIDAVGVGSSASPYLEGTALTSLSTGGEYAWVRKATGGVVQDTNANADDFVLVSTDGGIYNSVQAILGAPSPANSANQDVTSGIVVSLIEPLAAADASPNRVRLATPVDRFELRRRITNNTGASLSGIRLRVAEVTTLNSLGYSVSTQADLRPMTSETVSLASTSIGITSVSGLDLATPPAQALGGGWNSILTASIGPIANGASMDVSIALAILREGTESFAVTVETTGTLPVTQPVMDPPGGGYGIVQSVSLSTPTVGAEIRYTTDGSTPTGASTLYAGTPVAVNESKTLKAIGSLANWADSALASETYTLSATAPTIWPNGAVFEGAQAVALTSPTEAPMELWYTVDGSAPAAAAPSVLYSAPFNVTSPLVVRAAAFKTGWTSSSVSSATFTPVVATPAFSPAPGTYTTSQVVSLSSTTPGAVIHYTTDGSAPSIMSAVYSAPLTLTQTTTIRAAAYLAGWGDSLAAEGLFTIKVADPALSAAGGIYTTRRTVVITTATPSALIHYTTNGQEPTQSDASVASGATIVVDRAKVLKVKAFKASLAPSATVRADYVITGAIALAATHSLFLKEDGTVWSTGYNGYGQLGLGNTNNRQVPTQIPTTTSFHSIKAIAAGTSFSLFLKEDGTVWVAGASAVTGTGSNALSPVQVTAITVPVIKIAAGEGHALALDQTGRVWTWGSNTYGQLGTGNFSQRTSPCNPAVPPCAPSLTNVSAIAGGDSHTLAILGDKSMRAWGSNSSGQLGVGTRASNGTVTPASSTTPTTVNLASVSQIRAGGFLSRALTVSGEGMSWGDNHIGAGGRGVVVPEVPTPGVVLPGQRLIATGFRSGYLANYSGPVWVFGANSQGSLGDGTTTNRVIPRHSLPIPQRLALEGGPNSAAALTMAGEAYVWGYNAYGGLGLNNTSQTLSPVRVPDPASPSNPFLLASNSWLLNDDDGDGLSAGQELMSGLDPYSIDSNGDGLADATAYLLGGAALSNDPDGDGLTSLIELEIGTNPYVADTDGDSVSDLSDAFPLDSSRSASPTVDPNDHTAPVITLIAPAAQPIP